MRIDHSENSEELKQTYQVTTYMNTTASEIQASQLCRKFRVTEDIQTVVYNSAESDRQLGRIDDDDRQVSEEQSREESKGAPTSQFAENFYSADKSWTNIAKP